MIPLPKACEMLRRITFKIRIEKNRRTGAWEWATGFFVSKNGYAFTAYHNLPRKILQDGQGSVTIFFRDQEFTLDCLLLLSLPGRGDIAVLKLSNPPPDLVEPIPLGYHDTSKSREERVGFWMGKPVCIYGFPLGELGSAERFVNGVVDAGQPLEEEDIKSQRGTGPDIVGTVEWLRIVGQRAGELEGISGAPIFDLETGRIVGVEHRYSRGQNIVYGTEVGWVFKKHPDLIKELPGTLELGTDRLRRPGPDHPIEGDEGEIEKPYLRKLIQQCNVLPLEFINPDFKVKTGKSTLDLLGLYVALETGIRLVFEEGTDEEGGPARQEKLFVLPERETRPLGALEAAAREKQIVLLGDPGSGKSTFANYLALCLAGERLEKNQKYLGRIEPIWSHGALLPLRVTLREFSATAHCDGTAAGLWKYTEENLIKEDLPNFVPILHEHLKKGGVMVILDGLDQGTKPSTRSRVRKAVEDFAATHSHPSNRYLVTCRAQAYQEREAQMQGFAAYTLAPFNQRQIDLFIRYWQRETVEKGFCDRTEAEDFGRRLHEAVRNPDLMPLARSPLQLTMMASLYFSAKRLPRNQAELYREIMKLLLVRWGESPQGRKGGITRGGDRLEEALEQVAFKAHSASTELHGIADIKEEQLINVFQKDCTGGNWNKARELLEFIKKETGLLLEKGQGVYTFPHLSYQEYLAGAYLARQPDYPRMASRLARKNYGQWREVTLWSARIASLKNENHKAVYLAASLCSGEDPDDKVSDTGWQSACLAGELLVEFGPGKIKELWLDALVLKKVQGWLVAMLQQAGLEPKERAAGGNILSRLGDPRFREDAWYLPTDLLHGFVEVPAGPFLMGSDKDQHRIELPTYYIGRYPVTVAQFRAFVKDKGYKPEIPECLKGLDNHPVVNVTWSDALAYCGWLTEQLREWKGTHEELKTLLKKGKRGSPPWLITLPSEAEWEKAARGTDGRIYPWGNEPNSNRANYDDTRIGTTSSVGSFPGGKSPFVCQDMAGNVFEWMRSVYGEYPYNPKDGREDLNTEGRRVLRGGSFGNLNWSIRCANRSADYPSAKNGYVGFRVVLSPFLFGS